MKKTISILQTLVFLSLCAFAKTEKPNVIFIFADDMGWGEVQALNPEHGKIPTPYLDQMIADGITFTDAHTSSSVCTPSRYSLLTGRYNWRTTLQSFVLNNGADPLIASDRMTLGHLFRDQGYKTSIFGKWHLGYKEVIPEDLPNKQKPKKSEDRNTGPVPIGSKVKGGPITRGFDYYFGWNNARSMSSIVVQDTYVEEIDNVDVLPRLSKEVCTYIDKNATDAKAGTPFFLYMPLSSPHSPIVPHPDWKGKGELGVDYADFITQTDGCVGEVINALKRNGLLEDTLLIFSSDNGSSPERSPAEELGHKSHFPYSGSKGSLLEGGHRVPLIMQWPKKIPKNLKEDQLICLSDMMRTFAEHFSIALPDTVAEDSISFLPAMFGQAVTKPRLDIVHHDKDGFFAIRKGNWKLHLEKAEKGDATEEGQLYNLAEDIGEEKNLYKEHPEKVEELLVLLDEYVAAGRSTPGAEQVNDAKIVLWKQAQRKTKRKKKK